MFNDLRANPIINQRYQFWFYMYPTGQPFWISAKVMREDLAKVQQNLDPDHNSLALDQMVLVGHSMGGLISYLQTVDSGDHVWRLLSDQPFDKLQGDPAVIEDLRETLFFSANPQIKRVITVAMPYQGSDIANPTTRWLGRSLFKLPQLLTQGNSELVKQNPGLFRNSELLTIDTSVDSLASDSPFFLALGNVRPAPWTRYHNIYGRYQPASTYERVEQYFWGDGDGVVDVEKAQFPYAHSTDEVDGRHMQLHQTAKSIWVVRQALLQHLAEAAALPNQDSRISPPTNVASNPNHAGKPLVSTAEQEIVTEKHDFNPTPPLVHGTIQQSTYEAESSTPQGSPPANSASGRFLPAIPPSDHLR
jgi:hypothetical protein